MRYAICTIYDEVANTWTNPMTFMSPAQAVRSFQDHINGTQNDEMSKHPDDYSLYQLGTFDPREGDIELCTPSELLLKGANVLPDVGPTQE